MLNTKMNKDQFINYIQKIKEKDKLVSKVYKASNGLIDITNLEDALNEPFHYLESIFFTDIERDIISWYLYEYNKDRMKIWDSKTGEEIANIIDIEALWEYLNRE